MSNGDIQSGPMPTEAVRAGLLRAMLPADVFVYACIVAHTRKATWVAYPSISTIEKLTGLKRRSVTRATDRLEKIGAIRRERGRPQQATVYTIVHEWRGVGTDASPPGRDTPAPEAGTGETGDRDSARQSVGTGVSHEQIHTNTNPKNRPENKFEPVGKSASMGISESESTAKENQSQASQSADWTVRPKARMKWTMKVSNLHGTTGSGGKHPSYSPQAKADRTSSEKLFDEYIWPEGLAVEAGTARCEQALAMVPLAARNANKPMAYLTKQVQQAFHQGRDQGSAA